LADLSWAGFVAVFIPAFVTLFVVIDPPASAPIFASLTDGTTTRHKRLMAYRATAIATCILLFFALVGQIFLDKLGISLDAFRTAGGILLFIIALDMVFEKRTERREKRANEVMEEAQAKHVPMEEEDISVFPMALPMIAGPGAIGTIMLLMAKHENDLSAKVGVLAATAAVLVIVLFTLLLAPQLNRILGKALSTIITRVLGVILAAMAAQFVFDGVKNAFNL
jgi:multiple antibiotic resistance protein